MHLPYHAYAAALSSWIISVEKIDKAENADYLLKTISYIKNINQDLFTFKADLILI